MLTIVGSGKVGSSIALQAGMREVDSSILLLDIVKGLPQGEAMDINHTLAEQGKDTLVRGSNDYADMKGSDVVVIVAGVGRKPGMTRMDLLNTNAGIVRDVARKVAEYARGSIVVTVTNPLDPMTYITLKATNFKANRVMGMGNLLDLSRFKSFIAEELRVSRHSIHALVIGEHGENMLPLVRYSSIAGIPLTQLITAEKARELVERTRRVAAEVIALKGATIYAPANAVAEMLDAITKDRRDVMPVCAYPDGKYGVRDVCIGVPAIIGRDGVEEIIEVELSDEEKVVFDNGVKAVREAVRSVEI
ncbi:MAG: malate dehydrogenase [Candidatus Nitrosocaldus sp.]|nr:malate dehydrogenase [Candidatus Nitrosocaldus sp.]MCS7141215.1 malate dehydrogenase [Candidatus Nitrosocaldus sp.]MDW8000179.1 malate dehydrogenase [Candidatus Nitrosocaldus sp.]MDW8275633.1 malate dehydrogenase [Candidatus Nitrosocaldus sp.]